MKKFITAILLALVVSAQAATYVFSDCGSGAASGCTVGNDLNSGTLVAPYRTITKFKTIFQAAAAGDHLQFCQGGAWDSVATGNMLNINATATNPVTIESVDCTSFWSGGAGIRPKLNNASAAGVLSFNKGTPTHTEGYVIKGLELVGDGVNSLWGILIPGDTDYVTIDSVKITGMAVAIQCNGGTTVPQATGDGVTQHFTVKNSTISHNRGMGVLSGCDDSLVKDNTFLNNGTVNTDHDVYMGGMNIALAAKTISSIVGNGTTATLTTATPHNIPTGTHFTIGVSGSTSSGSGSFNVTGGFGSSAVVGTVTGPSTITYAATGTPSATIVGTYTILASYQQTGFTVQGNILTDSNIAGAGHCNLAKIISHGEWRRALIENNVGIETSTSSSNLCGLIEVTSGGYAQPENYEGFENVVIRGNTGINLSIGISLDITSQGLVENNYCHISYASGAFGIRMRGKNFAPSTVGTSTLAAQLRNPDNVTIRYNTVYLTAPNSSSWGIALNGNVGDALSGLHHNLYGNAVLLGSTATASTMCFNTQNMVMSWFDTKDYNACYYLGASVPKWENSQSLATTQGSGSDTHSVIASTSDATTDEPHLTAPATSPAISTSSGLKNTGHPSLCPRLSWGGMLRNQSTCDKGAYEYGASSLAPNSPTTTSAH